jgi:hypothetical protein
MHRCQVTYALSRKKVIFPPKLKNWEKIISTAFFLIEPLNLGTFDLENIEGNLILHQKRSLFFLIIVFCCLKA